MDLLEKAKAGDRQALEKLLGELEPRIYRFAMKLCRDPEDASGVLQETMLQAVRSLDEFRGDASLSTWLYSIARSFCIKKRRRSKFAPAHTESWEEVARREDVDIASPDRPPDEELARRELVAALEQAIAGLDEKYREVLVLRDVEGLPAQDVARVLGLSVAAVKSRLHRARAAVRDAVAPVLGLEAPAPGDACPDITDLFSRNLEGEISPEVCREMEKHLELCPRCRTACEGLKETLAVCGTLPVPEVPEEIKKSIQDEIRRLRSRSG